MLYYLTKRASCYTLYAIPCLFVSQWPVELEIRVPMAAQTWQHPNTLVCTVHQWQALTADLQAPAAPPLRAWAVLPARGESFLRYSCHCKGAESMGQRYLILSPVFARCTNTENLLLCENSTRTTHSSSAQFSYQLLHWQQQNKNWQCDDITLLININLIKHPKIKFSSTVLWFRKLD